MIGLVLLLIQFYIFIAVGVFSWSFSLMVDVLVPGLQDGVPPGSE